MRDITALEYSMIDGKIKIIAKQRNCTKGIAFLYLMLERLFPTLEEDPATLITDGGQDRGADAVYIREYNDTVHVTILQSKYAQSIKNANKNFPGNEVDKLITLLTDIINKEEGLIKGANPLLATKIKDIWNLINQGKTLNIQISLLSNGLPLASSEKERLANFCKNYEFVDFDELSYQSIVNLISLKNSSNEEGRLKCIDLQVYERSDCDIRGLVANIDAETYIEMISTNNGDSIKRHLFDENIRGYLGLSGGFNNQILESAVSDDNHLFWYLNNGITIIAKKFSFQNIRSTPIKLKKFQIVNGAQTSYSLFKAFKKNPDKIKKIILLVKIFESDREDISERIAIATNSQARITPRDLKANDHIQKKIENIFKDHDLLYERKQNQFDKPTELPMIDSRKLGQAILAYHCSEPHRAKTGSDEIFGKLYNSIFSTSLDGLFLVNLAFLYIFVSQSIEDELKIQRNVTIHKNDEVFIAYIQWHILYCIKILAKQDGKEIPLQEEFEAYYTRAKVIVASIAEEHEKQSYYRIFRSSKTKGLILQKLGLGQLEFEF